MIGKNERFKVFYINTGRVSQSEGRRALVDQPAYSASTARPQKQHELGSTSITQERNRSSLCTPWTHLLQLLEQMAQLGRGLSRLTLGRLH